MSNAKRNIRLLISLAVLTPATLVTYFLTNREGKPQIDKSIFAVEDLKSIDRIDLQSPTDTIVLTFNGTRWLVNEKYAADGRMIELIFATLLQEEPRRPVSGSQKDSLSNALEKSGIHVSLFSNNDLQREFYAGGNADKTQSYFKDSKTGNVYVMAIPGYRVYVSGIYETNESGFRDKYVFAFNWRNFKSLKATFPGKPKENFTVSLRKNTVSIEGMAKVDTARLNTFVDQVSLLTVDQYADSRVKGDRKPIMLITIDDIASRKYELTLFSPEEQGKIAGLVNGEPVLFEYRRIQPILRQRSFFQKQ
jgi:hypothetical protein